MTRVKLAGLVIAAAVALVPAPARADAGKGKASYDQLCTSCHGAGGKGDGVAAAALNPRPRDFTDAAYMSGLKDEYLFDLVKKGGAAVGKSALMPAWGGALSDEQIRDVIAYVRTLGK